MSLRLEAYCPAEGIAIIRTADSLSLVRPPYHLHHATVLSDEAIQDAILRHGFVTSGEQFGNWEDAISFLKQQTILARRSLGREIPESLSTQDILDISPPEVLAVFLDRVERELIPQRLFDQAEDFLFALLSSSVLTRFPDVGSRAARLMQINKRARDQAEAGISELANRDVRFPSLERRGEMEWSVRLTEKIRARGCVLALAS